MICKRCGAGYTRMAGVVRFRHDYGYCSVVCMTADKSPCLGCGARLARHNQEGLSAFSARAYCSQVCGASSANSAPKSVEHRQHMSEGRRRLPPEHWQKIRATRQKTLENDPARKEAMYQRMNDGLRRWKQKPDAEHQRAERYIRTMTERGHFQAASERMQAFYQTPEGEAFRQHVAQSKRGKPRPPIVRQKLRVALNAFWDTPEGIALRERISEQRTEGLPDTPYGPGWSKQAAKARARDRQCVMCGAARGTNGRVLDVHHIHPRRKFGYVPGQNVNYRWANHLANLMTLCPACHIRIELKGAPVPTAYQQHADELWDQFISLPH
jgi:hypothetical protein